MLILAGVLASTKRPGWKWLGIITGLTYCYLGVIALIVPSYAAGAWSQAGGLFALFLGALYILITLAEAEGKSQDVSAPVQKAALISEILPETGTVATSVSESIAAPSIQTVHKANEQPEMSK